MKKLLIVITLVLTAAIVNAQDSTSVAGPWKYNGMAAINFSQVSLTNWAQGGESSYAVNLLSAFGLNYAKNNSTWDNAIDMRHGIQKIGERDPGKTDDHIDLMSKYGYKASGDWYFSGMLNLKTQFTEGFQNTPAGRVVISDFMSPGYIQVSLGMEYKPSDKFFLSLSPLGGKVTVVLNDSLSNAGSYGVPAGETSRSELGGSVKISVTHEVMKNVTLRSTLDLFSNYIDTPQNVDVSWKAMLNMKVNEYLSANISTHLLYDDDIAFTDTDGTKGGARVQFKEILGIGFSVKF